MAVSCKAFHYLLTVLVRSNKMQMQVSEGCMVHVMLINVCIQWSHSVADPLHVAALLMNKQCLRQHVIVIVSKKQIHW